MFTHESFIDAVQNGKKQVVDFFVADQKFKSELNALIDSQTQTAKTAVKTSITIAEVLLSYVQTSITALGKKS